MVEQFITAEAWAHTKAKLASSREAHQVRLRQRQLIAEGLQSLPPVPQAQCLDLVQVSVCLTTRYILGKVSVRERGMIPVGCGELAVMLASPKAW